MDVMEGLHSPSSERSPSSMVKMLDTKTEREDLVGYKRGPPEVIHGPQVTAPTVHTHQPEHLSADCLIGQPLIKQEERTVQLQCAPRGLLVKQPIVGCGISVELCTLVKKEIVENPQLSTHQGDVIEAERGGHFSKIKLEPTVSRDTNGPYALKTHTVMMDGSDVCSNRTRLLTSQLGVSNPPVPVALYRREPTTHTNVATIANVEDQDAENFHNTLTGQPFSSCLSGLYYSAYVMCPTNDHTEDQSYTCSICEYSSTKTNTLTEHIKILTREKPYKCSVCDYSSAEKYGLVRHMRTHTGEKPFSCSTCNYSSAQNSDLVRHMRIHTGEKPYKCSICDYSSAERSGLIGHMRKHTGDKAYSCLMCGYRFAKKSGLHRHMRSHTGEKPYSCSICDFSSVQKWDLIRHTRTHTGVKPYSCTICDYSSAQKSYVVEHIRTHTGEKPYSCSMCSHNTTTKSALVRHRRTHTGEKPYTCSICDYGCVQRGDLVIHIRTHTGEKPFTCSICDRNFAAKSVLVKHMRIHTS